MKALLIPFLLVLVSSWAQASLNKIIIDKKDQKLLKNQELISIANSALQGLEIEGVYYGIDENMDEIKITAIYKNTNNDLVQIDLQGLGVVSGVDAEFGEPVFEGEEAVCNVSIKFNINSKRVVEAGCDIDSWWTE